MLKKSAYESAWNTPPPPWYKEKEKISEDNDLFHKLSQKLEKGDKELIQMNFFEGKTHKKISETLEIPLGTVKSRIRKVLTKLKEYIENT